MTARQADKLFFTIDAPADLATIAPSLDGTTVAYDISTGNTYIFNAQTNGWDLRLAGTSVNIRSTTGTAQLVGATGMTVTAATGGLILNAPGVGGGVGISALLLARMEGGAVQLHAGAGPVVPFPGDAKISTNDGSILVTAGGPARTARVETTGAVSPIEVESADGNITVRAHGAARTAKLATTGALSPVVVETANGDATVRAGGAGSAARLETTGAGSGVTISTSDGNVSILAAGAGRYAEVKGPVGVLLRALAGSSDMGFVGGYANMAALVAAFAAPPAGTFAYVANVKNVDLAASFLATAVVLEVAGTGGLVQFTSLGGGTWMLPGTNVAATS